jgi:tRNA(His) 5'-end guanylyltransferase
VKTDKLEERMRELECYHSMKILPGAYPVVRVDGRSFTKLTRGFEHPFDPLFHSYMVKTASTLMVELGGIYAFTESDEISILLPKDTDLFGREVEKIVSISAGIASSVFSIELGSAAHFDSRVWVGPTQKEVLDYFYWRQSDAARCCLNGWCYWKLREWGNSPTEATQELKGKSFSQKNDLLFVRGINFNEVPLWQRRGVGLYWEDYQKPGFNPKTKEPVVATRRRIHVDRKLPRSTPYGQLLINLMDIQEQEAE